LRSLCPHAAKNCQLCTEEEKIVKCRVKAEKRKSQKESNAGFSSIYFGEIPTFTDFHHAIEEGEGGKEEQRIMQKPEDALLAHTGLGHAGLPVYSLNLGSLAARHCEMRA
jgi:4-hydroxy-L-threonine phosphate dehydrogenase PdxA